MNSINKLEHLNKSNSNIRKSRCSSAYKWGGNIGNIWNWQCW